MNPFRSGRLSAILLFLLIFGIAVLSFFSAGTRRSLQESERREIELMQRIESLEKKPAAVAECPLPSPETIRFLDKQGLSPADLVDDLQERKDLIPFEGVLGGVMHFPDPNRIHVLTPRWVLAYFEDGHVAGEALLEYGIEKERITWKLIDAFLL